MNTHTHDSVTVAKIRTVRWMICRGRKENESLQCVHMWALKEKTGMSDDVQRIWAWRDCVKKYKLWHEHADTYDMYRADLCTKMWIEIWKAIQIVISFIFFSLTLTSVVVTLGWVTRQGMTRGCFSFRYNTSGLIPGSSTNGCWLSETQTLWSGTHIVQIISMSHKCMWKHINIQPHFKGSVHSNIRKNLFSHLTFDLAMHILFYLFGFSNFAVKGDQLIKSHCKILYFCRWTFLCQENAIMFVVSEDKTWIIHQLFIVNISSVECSSIEVNKKVDKNKISKMGPQWKLPLWLSTKYVFLITFCELTI